MGKGGTITVSIEADVAKVLAALQVQIDLHRDLAQRYEDAASTLLAIHRVDLEAETEI